MTRWKAMDVLHEHSEQIEKQVFFQVANLFNLSVDLIFYDTTTASFSVDYEDEGEESLRRYGHAKEIKETVLSQPGRYKRYLAITDDQTIRIDRQAIRDAAKYDGKWVLETNDDTISMEDAAHGYRGLMVIERCFRSLKKTRIRMMPMYHWLPRRIEAHVKICVLALLLERLAEIKCNKSWSKIRSIQSKIQATEFETPGHGFFQLNELPKGEKR